MTEQNETTSVDLRGDIEFWQDRAVNTKGEERRYAQAQLDAMATRVGPMIEAIARQAVDMRTDDEWLVEEVGPALIARYMVISDEWTLPWRDTQPVLYMAGRYIATQYWECERVMAPSLVASQAPSLRIVRIGDEPHTT